MGSAPARIHRGIVVHLLIALLLGVAEGRSWGAQLLPEKTPRPNESPTAPPKSRATPNRPRLPMRLVVPEPDLVLISAGEFWMGSANGREDERPSRRVYVSEFYISRYPVSNLEYKRFVDATQHRAPAGQHKERQLWNGRNFPSTIARQPVVEVSWEDASTYCRWLSRATGKHYELPTEAEWEKAARGNLEQKNYPWGDEPPDDRMAWFGKRWNGLETLQDVGYGVANGYGLFGMAGNVYQWVADRYNAHTYADSAPRDPQGPLGGVDRVVRGGSVFEDANHLRCASRNLRPPADRLFDVGFRVVRK